MAAGASVVAHVGAMTNSRDMATSVAIGILVIVFVAEMQDDASGFALEARARSGPRFPVR